MAVQSSPLVSETLAQLLPGKAHPRLNAMLAKVLQLEQLDQIYLAARPGEGGGAFARRILKELDVRARVTEEDLARIPKHGPVVAVANHPFGMVEGALLAGLLPQVRPDVRILANHLLSFAPEFDSLLIPVDPFGGPDAAKRNAAGLRSALEWLEQGGLLVVFPSGEVSHFDFKRRGISDPEWNCTAVRLARRTKAQLLPLYFHGANSALFQAAGVVHPKLRTLLLPHEFVNKRARSIELRVGTGVTPERIAALDDERATDLLRHRTYMLRHRRRPRRRLALQRRLISPVPPDAIELELSRLSPLLSLGNFQIFQARAGEIPATLREIGRRREESFRVAGEGTGHSFDLDRFDQHYWQLFLWDRTERRLAGGYRLCPTDAVRPDELYTHSLFRYGADLLERLHPALELGRSFVAPEYQRSYQPLHLLWKGIGAWLVRNPRYRYLFGPVSISSLYHPLSRNLMMQFLERECRDDDLSRLVSPRKPARRKKSSGPPPADFDELSSLVSDIEPGRQAPPVLLRHYLNLGGRILGFNVDKEFGHALDALLVVDLRRAPKRTLDRYLGKSRE